MSFIKNSSTDFGLLVLRVMVSMLMIFPHGYSKLIGFSAKMNTFPDPLGIGSMLSLTGAVFTEFVCSILLILGIKTRWFSIPLLFTMFIAAFVVHANDPWKIKEKAIIFGVCYLVLIITGGGKYSVRE
jgi:putative oxidoreductase